MTGTVNQIGWAKQIKTQVNAEFDRVASALRSASTKQSSHDRMDIQAIIAILEDKRAEVIANEQAGYFIHDLAGAARSSAADDRGRLPV